MMRILIAHNRYQQSGGEDAVAMSEVQLLKERGHDVEYYEKSNAEYNNTSTINRIKQLSQIKWSKKSYRDFRATIRAFRPNIVHFHNIFFVLTPSVYQACYDEGVPVVHSLHNFRLLCSNGLFLRNNQVCEECQEKKSLWRGVRYGCYKNSKIITMVVVRMLDYHWKKGTWSTLVDSYIMATEFGRQKYIAAGIPAEKIFIKPHFFPVHPTKKVKRDEYALFVGRISEEKGSEILIKAWKKISDLPLKIIGDGVGWQNLKQYAIEENINNVEFLGFVSSEECHSYLRGAKFLILPSICYENFPRIVAEAYASGVPILASHLGGMPEFVKDKETGLLFEAGDPDDLAVKVKELINNEDELSRMRKNIEHRYEQKYSPDVNYEILMDIYQATIKKYYKNKESRNGVLGVK